MAIKKRKKGNGNANEERAHRAELAMQYYGDISGNDGEPERDNLTDLLTDIRHYAGTSGLDFDESARMAQIHYEAEIEEDSE